MKGSRLTILCVLFVTSVGVLRASEDVPAVAAESQWEFKATPYFWFLSIDGDATMNGVTGDVDMDFSDIWDVFNYGGVLRMDAYKDKWGFKTDIVMVDMGEDFRGPLGNKAEVDLRQWAVDFVVSYELYSVAMDEAEKRELTISPYTGFRYNYLKQKVRLPAPIGAIGDSQDWVDLLVGASVKMDLTEKLSANIEGDAGGFEIGSSSDLTWQIIAGFNYELSETMDLYFGYRHTDIDYNRGSGNNEFGVNAEYSGPFTGLTIKW